MSVLNFWKDLDWFQKMFVGIFAIFLSMAVWAFIQLAENGALEMNPMLIALIGVMVVSAIGMLIEMLRY